MRGWSGECVVMRGWSGPGVSCNEGMEWAGSVL